MKKWAQRAALAFACGALSLWGYEGGIWARVTLFFLFLLLALIAHRDRETLEIRTASLAVLLGVVGISFVTIPHVKMWERLLGAFAVSVPMLIAALCVEGAFGGGDIKLMWVGGLFLGWRLTLISIVIALLTGGLYAGVLLVSGRKKGAERFAFGPYLCLGIIVSFLWGGRLWDWYRGLMRR